MLRLCRFLRSVIQPIEIPVFGAIGIVALVFFVSRVLLAVSESASWMIAIGFGMVAVHGTRSPSVARKLACAR